MTGILFLLLLSGLRLWLWFCLFFFLRRRLLAVLAVVVVVVMVVMMMWVAVIAVRVRGLGREQRGRQLRVNFGDDGGEVGRSSY